jgi:tetratricopeptide (TPR) repeat protein
MPPLRLPLAALAGWLLLAGCGPSADAPLPPETDLYAYSLAVAERAGRVVPAAGAKALFHVGRVHERFGLEDKALAVYRQAIEEDPELTGPHLRTGFILAQRKDRMSEAVDAYNQALRTDSRAPGVYTRLGLVFTHQGRLEDAVRAFEEELRMGTANEDTYYNLGQAFSLQAMHEKAVEAYAEASRRAPGMRSAYYSLAQSLRALGRLDEEKVALDRFRKLKEEEDRASAHRDAAGEDRAGQLEHAAETWMDAAEIFADAVTSAKEPGERQKHQQEFRRAVEEAIRLGPRLVEPRRVLIDYWKSVSDMGKAVQVAEDALKAIPGDPALTEAAHALAGKCLESARGAQSPAGWVDLAERLLRAAAKSMPSFPDGRRELARLILFWRRDRPDLLPEALAEARAALQLHPSPENYDVLAYALHRSGQVDVALRTLLEGLQRHPDDATLKQRVEKMKELTEGKDPR